MLKTNLVVQGYRACITGRRKFRHSSVALVRCAGTPACLVSCQAANFKSSFRKCNSRQKFYLCDTVQTGDSVSKTNGEHPFAKCSLLSPPMLSERLRGKMWALKHAKFAKGGHVPQLGRPGLFLQVSASSPFLVSQVLHFNSTGLLSSSLLDPFSMLKMGSSQPFTHSWMLQLSLSSQWSTQTRWNRPRVSSKSC